MGRSHWGGVLVMKKRLVEVTEGARGIVLFQARLLALFGDAKSVLVKMQCGELRQMNPEKYNFREVNHSQIISDWDKALYAVNQYRIELKNFMERELYKNASSNQNYGLKQFGSTRDRAIISLRNMTSALSYVKDTDEYSKMKETIKILTSATNDYINAMGIIAGSLSIIQKTISCLGGDTIEEYQFIPVGLQDLTPSDKYNQNPILDESFEKLISGLIVEENR
jgi:hypothetical protein